MDQDHSCVHVDVRAVDVGYFNVKYTKGAKQAGTSWPVATGIFPALAPRLESGAVIPQISGAEKLDGIAVEVDGVNYFVGKDAAFNSSGIDPRNVAEDYSCSAKYLALLRGALAGIAADVGAADLSIGHLVLALPLHTFPAYREQLAARASGQHLIGPAGGPYRRVIVERVHVIVQPHGALLNHGLKNNGKLDGLALIVDPGGGTLDWYVASKEKSSWPRSGAYPKAMLACSYAVLDQIKPGLRDQFQVVERVDQAIRDDAVSFRIEGREYALEGFRHTIDSVLDEGTGKMLAKVGTTADIDKIILVGGGARVFQRFLVAARPDLRERIHRDGDPVFSNVCGFHIYGELLRTRNQIR